MPANPELLAIVIATFLLAGTAKGVVGFGLPTIALALLTLADSLYGAMAMLLLPSLVTNVWQAVAGGSPARLVRRLWRFLLAGVVGVWVGLWLAQGVETLALVRLLGLLLVIYGLSGLLGWRPVLSTRRDRLAGPVAGALNGVLTGMTGSFVVPGVMYLQALGLARDQLVQAMGILFTVSTLALLAALAGRGLLSPELGLMSAIGVPAALVGMVLGRRIRSMLPEARFRQVFQAAIMALGLSVMASGGA
ncbi:MAG: sulfite exporter TauE/SafE family protein [Minwuia sp.]|nr:sulfite exporter TauE/SafE family protein [Minwuia sp.]